MAGSTPNGRVDRSKKPSKVVVLNLSSALLARFNPKKESEASTPVNGVEELPVIKPTLSGDNASEANSTPAPGQEVSTPSDGTKKRKAPGTGPRKSLNPLVDSMPKPRGKPGPKKKARLDDGTIDHNSKLSVAGNVNHKLGPKANTGAINAGLRALDRTGTKCRKWNRKSFQLKSFTGVVWEIPTWKGGDKSSLSKDTDSTSEAKDISMQSSSDAKAGSDAAMSNVDETRDNTFMITPIPSSPAPVKATPSIAA